MKNTFKKIIVKILTWESKLILARYHPRIIAITGSVGKTSTKDAIYSVISKFHTVRKSEKSFNSEIGLPLTILGVKNGWNNPFVWAENILRGIFLIVWKNKYPEWLVLEIGAGKPGDIKSVAPWVRPDIVVLTRFPDVPVHVEFFGSTESIIEEKLALAHSLKKNGVLIVNHDDPRVFNSHQEVGRRTVSYGLNEHATYKATYPAISVKPQGGGEEASGLTFKLENHGNTFPVYMPHIIGESHMYSGLAALAVASEIGCDILTSIEALKSYRTPRGRINMIDGMNGSILIDDTYNASPVAMEAAIKVLDSTPSKRKIAVLGDMLELGKRTEEAHRAIGEQVAKVANILVLVGPRTKFIKDGAREKKFKEKNIYMFDTSITAGKFLAGIVEGGDVVLLKGSQGVRLERAVEAIMAHPEEAKDLLCRQEKEWKNR
jgi:UDP-N-acetylmuramoyl-tripeptide--D-alanyl-D-alanine ligase